MTSNLTSTVTAARPSPAASVEPLHRLRAAALVAGPVLLVLGSLAHPAEASGTAMQLATVADDPTRWWAAHLPLLLGLGLLVPALHALAGLLDHWAPRRTRVGTVLTGIGVLGVFGLIATESTATWALSRAADVPQAAGVLDDVLAAETALFVLPVLCFHVGLVLLALAVRVTPGGGAARAALLAGGSVAIFVGNGAHSVLLATFGGVLLAAALVPLGLQALRAGQDA